MTTVDVERLRQIKTLPSLVKFLCDELNWPVEADEIDDLTFDYTTEELGLDPRHAVNVKEIKQLRPLDSKQPWGIFWINFEKKRLPMVVLRRILGNLIIKSRAGARKADRPSWHLHDLLFISSYGEEEHRNVSFAHFSEAPDSDELPVLRVLGWDDQNSIMHLDRVANRLHSHFRWPDDPQNVEAWRKCWSEAFTDRYREAIRSAEELIPRLANLAAGVRRRVRDVLDAETERGPMRRLFAAVQKLLIHDMNEDGFADMYAQTVAYGLLSARFSRPTGLTAQNLVQLTAVSNPFLENLLENLFRLNRGKFHFDVDEVGINDVLDLLRNTNIEAIKAAFSDKNPAEDPVIRFYEGFLKQYDPQQRIKRGVFFTPRPVVSYIVRSVHELLQTEFGLEDGLASTVTWQEFVELQSIRNPKSKIQNPEGVKPSDPFVCILDPAVGTGTFLFECIEVIERTMKDKWCRELGKEKWNDPEILRRWREYVPKYLLPRLYGYELMMAPYSIAHLKLALKLGETGYQFREGDRLHIYLTNSLEPPTELADATLADMFTTLAAEAQEVNEIKAGKRFTVVIGNPPYAGISSNMTEHAQRLVDTYKFVNGAPLKERKLWLQDDYVKFIRIAQTTIEQSGWGLLGYITNHGYLDNPTFRGMRQSLMASFQCIHVLDLHGNPNKKEQSPDGAADKNVFDILQGVAICLAIHSNVEKSTQHAELWGARESKYKWLAMHHIGDAILVNITPDSPYYFLVPQDTDRRTEYESALPINELMPLKGVGVVTARDALSIDVDPESLWRRVARFAEISTEDAREQYDLGSDAQSWKVSWAQRDVQQSGPSRQFIKQVLYRPFDSRFIYYTGKSSGFICRPVLDTMRHMMLGMNLGLITARSNKSHSMDHFFCTISLMETKCGEATTQSYLFPLYIFASEGGLGIIAQRQPNLNLGITTQWTRVLGVKSGSIAPENIFHYAYAVFHSPGYRTRYAEFLRIDFPRLPLTSSLELFRELARLGGELVALHLMESPKLDKAITKWRGATPSGEIEKVAYADATVWIDKAKTEGFRGVPENVWNFHIGGYQVCQKWLKDRKGRTLTADDIAHYHRIVIALSETIRLMGEIDEVIERHGGWPGAFAEPAR